MKLQSACARVSCALAGKGCGFFIVRSDGPDVFVHYLGIDGYGFRSLEEGHRVEFEETQGPRESTDHQCPRRMSGARDRKP
jgi:cold shock CspA family protein